MIWRFGRHFALVVLVCVVAGKREISLCVVPGGGHFVLVLYVWYAKYVDLSRGKTNEVPIVVVSVYFNKSTTRAPLCEARVVPQG